MEVRDSLKVKTELEDRYFKEDLHGEQVQEKDASEFDVEDPKVKSARSTLRRHLELQSIYIERIDELGLASEWVAVDASSIPLCLFVLLSTLQVLQMWIADSPSRTQRRKIDIH